MRRGWTLLLLIGLAGTSRAEEPRERQAIERGVAYLAKQVPSWRVENHCRSCHHNGDAARALYTARRAGLAVPPESLADTTAWLGRPDDWDSNGPQGPFSDKKLAQLQFSSALATGVETGAIADRKALAGAAKRIASDQQPEGFWATDGVDALGSPVTRGRPLAAFLAVQTLRLADRDRFRPEIDRALEWLRQQPMNSTLDAAVALRSGGNPDRTLDFLRRGQGEEGGWGPYVNSPPETFDTAVALWALAPFRNRPEVAAMIRRGRAYLVATQQADGSWPETTRPPGTESLAQRTSTTAWVVLAMLELR